MISKSVVTFWVPASYGRWVFRHFRGKYCPHLQGNWIVSTSTWTNALWQWRHYMCSSEMLEHLTATWFGSPEGVNHLFTATHYLKCYILKYQYVKKTVLAIILYCYENWSLSLKEEQCTCVQCVRCYIRGSITACTGCRRIYRET